MPEKALKDVPVKVAMVGLGDWAYAIAEGIKRTKKVSLVKAFTRTAEKKEKFCKRYNCHPAASLEEILDDPTVEALILTTPNSKHCEHTILGAERGKHIFVEKPIANTIEEAKKMIKVCQDKEVVLAVGHNLRRFPLFRKMKSLIEKGAIGTPVMAEGNYSHNLGLELTSDTWRWYELEAPSGPLIQVGIHLIDTLQYFFGPVKRVFSTFSDIFTPSQIPDVTSTTLYFENGLVGYIGSAYVIPFNLQLSVYGTEANLFCDYVKGLFLQKKNSKEKVCLSTQGIDTRDPEPLREEIDEFAECIRGEKEPEVDGRRALQVLAVVQAAIKSNKEKRVVSLKEILPLQFHLL